MYVISCVCMCVCMYIFTYYLCLRNCTHVSIGMVLEALRQFGIENNTLVLFTSDNGPEVSTDILQTHCVLLSSMHSFIHLLITYVLLCATHRGHVCLPSY